MYGRLVLSETRAGITSVAKGTYLCDFVTTREQKRKGYGRELLNLMKEKTKGQFIYLIVHSSYEKEFPDDKLIEFYKSVGFKVHEQKDEYKCYTWMVLDNR